jgi:hypothetical protein
MMRNWIIAFVGCATLAFARSATATPNFPGEIQSTLNMPCAPTCTLCHATEQGGGTPVTPFGKQMVATGGLVPFDVDSLKNALNLLQTSAQCFATNPPTQGPCDSDGDGTPDIEELQAGQDPNTPGGDLCGSQPRYGCGARVAPASAGIDWVSLLIAGITVAGLARTVRRRRNKR